MTVQRAVKRERRAIEGAARSARLAVPAVVRFPGSDVLRARMLAAVEAHPRGAVMAPRKGPPPVPACPCGSGQPAGACSLCDAYPWDPPAEVKP